MGGALNILEMNNRLNSKPNNDQEGTPTLSSESPFNFTLSKAEQAA
jgi:hypothetical protein